VEPWPLECTQPIGTLESIWYILLQLIPYSPPVIAHICNQANASVFVIESMSDLKRILEGRTAPEAFPTVKTFILMDGKATEDVGRPVIPWDEFMKLGEQHNKNELRKIMDSLTVNTACSLLYTSGTTGMPKGIILVLRLYYEWGFQGPC